MGHQQSGHQLIKIATGCSQGSNRLFRVKPALQAKPAHQGGNRYEFKFGCWLHIGALKVKIERYVITDTFRKKK